MPDERRQSFPASKRQSGGPKAARYGETAKPSLRNSCLFPAQSRYTGGCNIGDGRPMTEANLQPDTNTPLDAATIGDAGANAAHADFSLRSSGPTYIERAKEAQDIVERIRTSSASVIGIAGVRGAGKSSLAKKVLDKCKADDFFTLLIPSPTEYDPKDFLLAIFQRIAEHATERVRTIIEGADSLAELGNHQARRLDRQLKMVIGGLFLFGLIGLAGVVLVSKIKASDANAKLSSDLTNMLDAVVREQKRRTDAPALKPTAPTKTPVATDSGLPTSVYESLKKASLTDFITRIEDREQLSDGLLSRLFNSLNGEIASLKPTPDFEIKYRIELSAIILLILLALMLAAALINKIRKKLQSLREHKIQYGLRDRCRTFMELIKYQSVLGSSKELNLTPQSFAFLSGKFSSSKTLEDRPLSLPGLTANCSTFLRDVAEVFSGKVVICIDELDKITDVAELFRLLKGIKGILGQENTHFILTVSEDAMAFFNERLSRERSLVESSFEEIVYLDRLSLDVTNKVIRQSLAVSESTAENFLRNCTVQWVFAGGIPREIKRNLFTCYSRGISMNEGSSIELWRLLYLNMLNSMLAMSTPKEAAGVEDQYKFLICIETLIGRVKSLPDIPDFHAFIREVLGILRLHFGSAFRPLLAAHPNYSAKMDALNVKPETSSSSVYFAQLVEALIGALILAVANNDIASKENDAAELDLLIYVYKYVPINPRYSFYGLNRFLETKLKSLEIDLNDLLADPRPPKLAAL